MYHFTLCIFIKHISYYMVYVLVYIRVLSMFALYHSRRHGIQISISTLSVLLYIVLSKIFSLPSSSFIYAKYCMIKWYKYISVLSYFSLCWNKNANYGKVVYLLNCLFISNYVFCQSKHLTGIDICTMLQAITKSFESNSYPKTDRQSLKTKCYR